MVERKPSGKAKPTNVSAARTRTQAPVNQAFEIEYPLSAPYEFEGFTTPQAALEMLQGVSSSQALARQDSVTVIREGQNRHGLWGYLFTLDGKVWVPQGHTLEPRADVGKGPIPLGRYAFSRWASPRLGKTLRLHNVPGFTDILVHVGNTSGDTVGCILAGKKVDRDSEPTRLVDSRTLTDWLYDTQSDGNIIIESR